MARTCYIPTAMAEVNPFNLIRVKTPWHAPHFVVEAAAF